LSKFQILLGKERHWFKRQ